MKLTLRLKDRTIEKDFTSLTYGQLIKFVAILDVKEMAKTVTCGEHAALYFLGKWAAYYDEIEKLLLEIFDEVTKDDLDESMPDAIVEVVTEIFSETLRHMIGVGEKERDLIRLILGEEIKD